MKTKVEKIENKVKMKLWGTHWRFTTMAMIIAILWIAGNIEALKEGPLWHILIVGLFGAIIRVTKIPLITILVLIALFVLNRFHAFHADEVILANVIFMMLAMGYDHLLLRKEAKSRTVSHSEKKEYLDMMYEALEKAISHLYEKREYYNLKSDKLKKSLEYEEKEFEAAKKFSGDTRNFEKPIQRKEIDIKEIKDLLKKNQDTEKELKEAMDNICLSKKLCDWRNILSKK